MTPAFPLPFKEMNVLKNLSNAAQTIIITDADTLREAFKQWQKEEAEKLQKELADIRAEGSSGGRMVTITLNGKFEMIGIKLDPICVDNRDVQMLEDLIVSAHKNAVDNVQEQIKAKSSSLLGGLDLGQFGL